MKVNISKSNPPVDAKTSFWSTLKFSLSPWLFFLIQIFLFFQ